MTMIQRKFYLPEELYLNLQLLAKMKNQTITQTLRDLLVWGLKQSRKTKTGGTARKLVELAKIAEKENWAGPRDLSLSHNKYFLKARRK